MRMCPRRCRPAPIITTCNSPDPVKSGWPLALPVATSGCSNGRNVVCRWCVQAARECCQGQRPSAGDNIQDVLKWALVGRYTSGYGMTSLTVQVVL